VRDDSLIRRPPDPDRPRRYHIKTWGCQMNVHDSEKIAGRLEDRGYRRADDEHDADVILLNTCSIREKAEDKVYDELGRLRRLKESRAGLVVGVCGCVAQQEGERILERAPHVDAVLGPRAGGTLGDLLDRIDRGDSGGRVGGRAIADTALRRDSIDFPFERIRRDGLDARKAYVTVVEGCNHRCTYCIVPTTRGREVCRSSGEILREVAFLAAKSVIEIEFLGQTVNAYRDPEGRTLADLLRGAANVPGVRRVRFTTSHPAQMTPELISAMAETAPVTSPYLHLPVQSGSSRVLAEMKRGYDREGYLRRIAALRERLPGLCLGTDVIVGYPTETEADFRETLSLLEAVEFDTCFSFAYSPRPGTAAAAIDDPVPLAQKLERLARLQELQKGIQFRRAQRWVGSAVEVLIEGASRRQDREWTGRTPENRVVNFAGHGSVGQLQWVRVVRASAFSLRGEPCTPGESS